MSRFRDSVLLVVDLQQDFLDRPGLEPPASAVVDSARRWLEAFRAADRPVSHVQTIWEPHDDRRMARWKRLGVVICQGGTPGARPPIELMPVEGEPVVLKHGFLPSRPDDILEWIRNTGAARVVVAGAMAHACVSHLVATLLSAGLEVTLAAGAVASDSPQAAAHALSHWASRGVVEQSLDESSGDPHDPSPTVDAVSITAASTDHSWSDWPDLRKRLLDWAARLEDSASMLADEMARSVGKPVALGRAETIHAAETIRDVCVRRDRFSPESDQPPGMVARRPLGVVAILTPWNNPVAIPVGRIAPALAYGNEVVWKPAPFVDPVSRRLHESATAAGLQFRFVPGDAEVGERVVSHPHVDGVSFSGSLARGRRVLAACTERMIPCLLEMGGNNGAIVADDADLDIACREIARGAFAFAGQRCTANRRVILMPAIATAFIERLRREMDRWAPSNPFEPECRIGPVKDRTAAVRIESLLSRIPPGATVTRHHVERCRTMGARFVAPALVEGVSPEAEIVQEETFGPVLVALRADSWPDSLRLLNGVRQGLVASLFSSSHELWAEFATTARAGVLRWNVATDGAVGDLPFGGWGTSGWGGAEHGEADPLFFTRLQTRLTRGAQG